jgi:hypothetical protein
MLKRISASRKRDDELKNRKVEEGHKEVEVEVEVEIKIGNEASRLLLKGPDRQVVRND